MPYARPHAPSRDFVAVIESVKPTVLIGVSTKGKAFNRAVVEAMARVNNRPIIFALSNPTEHAECTAEEAYRWSDGRAFYAAGAPSPPVRHGDKTLVPGQGNNLYVFPAVGLAIVATKARRVTDEMFVVAARAVADQVTQAELDSGLLYPPQSTILQTEIAVAIQGPRPSSSGAWPASSSPPTCGDSSKASSTSRSTRGTHDTQGSDRQRIPHRRRRPGKRRGPGGSPVGRPDPAVAPQFPDRGGALPLGTARDPRPRHPEEVRGPGERGAGPTAARESRPDRPGGAGGDRRQARRRVPAGCVPDRLGHPDQHERQRADRQPGHPARRRRGRLEDADPPQRRRQPQPVVQRHLPHRDAHRHGRAVGRRADARDPHAAGYARRQGPGVLPRGDGGPDAPPGCDALDPRPGDL